MFISNQTILNVSLSLSVKCVLAIPPPPHPPHPPVACPIVSRYSNAILQVVVLTYKSIRHFTVIDTLISKQNVRRFADDTFEFIFMNENAWISIKISPKDLPKGQIKN